MWDQSGYDNDGGFMDQGMGSQATPGGTGEKRRKAQNLVPMKIRDIILCEEESVKIEGRDVGMVDIIGLVKSVEQTATKTVYILQDLNGQMEDDAEIEAIKWTDEDSNEGYTSESVTVGMNGRIIGSLRTVSGKKHVMVFKITPVVSSAELQCHNLECVYAKLKIRQLIDKENGVIGSRGPTIQSSLSNSMVGSGMMGSGGMPRSGAMGAVSMGNSFGNSKHDAVFKLLTSCTRDEGLGRDEILEALRGKMNRKELDDALDYLSGEGHIYSTTDDDHFKSTDS
jgi:replication factor A2